MTTRENIGHQQSHPHVTAPPCPTRSATRSFKIPPSASASSFTPVPLPGTDAYPRLAYQPRKTLPSLSFSPKT
ncbi:hypothetical protein BO94DRAFT_538256 [Aspergillus sclerotioniger CBS 115572]|uniref:Uncharacterized protein n=1 Tax=Aspergillus sclerotioniger CBS 115572 TaxID=1450535 RepID=A0A317VTP5_9EURO|nr:hypothetical protein BO94DRAFT_538256 [Aspergillus sclerotioniger CBS 115572]PWY76387.1 hypothetical protein BO94DRAFT_538256 [Aspergillus sclerotioniger CBS 115572]